MPEPTSRSVLAECQINVKQGNAIVDVRGTLLSAAIELPYSPSLARVAYSLAANGLFRVRITLVISIKPVEGPPAHGFSSLYPTITRTLRSSRTGLFEAASNFTDAEPRD